MPVIVLAHTKFKHCGMELIGRGLPSLRQVQDTAARISKYLSVSVEVFIKVVARYFFCSRKLIHNFQVSVSRKIVRISFSFSERVFSVVILRSQLEGGYYKHPETNCRKRVNKQTDKKCI
jgi:hypothetical protein